MPCGGSRSLIDQQREQWTDGANAFALAPGVITTYRRNYRTTDELARRGGPRCMTMPLERDPL